MKQRGGRRDRERNLDELGGERPRHAAHHGQPGSAGELRAAVVEAAGRGETVRVAGAGHSFAPLCATNGTLLDLSRLAGVERIDATTGEATIWAGTRIADLGEPLLVQGRAFANQGDIDRQAIAGAVSTGTHGTGRKHGSFAAAVRAVELMRSGWHASHDRRHRAGTTPRGLAQPGTPRRAYPGDAGDRSRLQAA